MVANAMRGQSSKMPELRQWHMFLAALIAFTFDLCLIFPASAPEDNFYYRLNQARPTHTFASTRRAPHTHTQ